MQTIQEVNAEQLAKLFHHYHEALQHDCDAQSEGCSSWERAPQSQRKLMIARRPAGITGAIDHAHGSSSSSKILRKAWRSRLGLLDRRIA